MLWLALLNLTVGAGGAAAFTLLPVAAIVTALAATAAAAGKRMQGMLPSQP